MKRDTPTLAVLIAAAPKRAITVAKSESRRWFYTPLVINAAIIACSLTLIGILLCLVAVQLRSEKEEIVIAAIKQNSNLVKALEEHAIRTIKSVDTITHFLSYEYARLGSKVDVSQLIEKGYIDSDVFTVVTIIDERGNILTSSRTVTPVSLAGRETFKAHISQDSGKLYIGQTVLGLRSSKPVFQVTRRINKADGSFGGVVSVGVDPEYFIRFYRKSDLGKNGVAILAGLDKMVRARLGGQNATFGEDMSNTALIKEQQRHPSGNYLSKGTIDGIPRYISYRTLVDYPLLIAVGISQDEVLAEYSKGQREDYLTVLMVSAAIAVFAGLLIAALTRQRRTVVNLTNSESRLRATFNQAAVGISQTALGGQFLQVNQKLCDIVGYSEQDLLMLTVQSITHPDDLSESLAHRSLLASGEVIPEAREKRYLRQGGTPVWTSVATTLVYDARGAPSYFVNMIEDITARKLAEGQLRESEQIMRAAFENAAVGIIHVGLDARYLQVNAKFCALLGYSRDELMTMTTRHTNHPDERDQLGVANQQLLSGQVQEYCSEKRFVRKDGTALWARRTSSLVRDSSGAPLYFIRVVEDITDRKGAETALLRLKEELEEKVIMRTADLERAKGEAEEASRAKSSFLAAMSHEIRTPMNGVIGMIDVLHQSSLQGDQVEMVKLIRESAFSLLGIINDILDFSKIEAGKLELDQEPVSVETVVVGVCNLLTGMAEKKDVALTLYTDPTIPELVVGDALRLRQVLTNLTNNAIKFSGGRAKAGRVSVRALMIEKSAQRVIIEFQVVDNGIGMDEITQAKLFTAFAQADVSTTRRFGGTGLGLVIAHNLALLMGGEITVQSAVGLGATFKMRLPFVRPPVSAEPLETAFDLSGLTCVVIGAPQGMADDLAIYLKHAKASVERMPDLASAKKQAAGWHGLPVWVIDAGNGSISVEQIRAVAHAQDVRQVVVLIGRGKRRRPRAIASDMTLIDGNALDRRTFLKAVAIAAGRASSEPKQEKTPSGKITVIAPSREQALQNGRLILIAEDNETNQKVIMRQLALLGYTADLANDGLAALERWRSGDYALLLTDLHMPQLDGYELAQAIRAEEKDGAHIPIIALTANALKGEADHCLAVGMDDYRSKPSPLAELKSVFEKWLPALPLEVDVRLSSSDSQKAQLQASTALPVDVSILKQLVGDDPAIIQEFLQDFRASAGKIALELREACAAGQPIAAANAAHKLKSSARAVGALALGDRCAAIENEGMVGSLDSLEKLLSQFEAEMATVEGYLATLGAQV